LRIFVWRSRSDLPTNGVFDGLPGRANATIRSRAATRTASSWSRLGTAATLPQSVDLPDVFDKAKRQCRDPDRWRRYRRSRSLRLSVRTPPFHGGESGSIPLGSANARVPL